MAARWDIINRFKRGWLYLARGWHKSDAERRRLALAVRVEQMMKGANDAIVVADERDRILEVNDRMVDMYGYDASEFQGMRVLALRAPETRMDYLKQIEPLRLHGRAAFETTHRRKDGSVFPVEVSMRWLEVDGARLSLGIIRDITQRRELEEERDVTVRLLRLLNAPSTLGEMVREVTLLLKDWSGCEAVGIRLRDGDDFPYAEARGFPAEFVRMENSLCRRDAGGASARDSGGNPVLECMCGNVLCGRFDAAKSFFTERGTFWSNCTTDLLARTTDADRQGRTCNRCNGEGYESVALVALRSGTTVHGLLQFNDRRKDRFTPGSIALMERLADNLANAVALRRSEESLRQREAQNRAVIETTRDGFMVLDAEGRLLEVNDAYVRQSGYSREELLAMRLADLEAEPRPGTIEARIREVRREGGALVETEHRAKDGTLRQVEVNVSYWPIAGGRLFAFIRDTSERKRLEAQLRQAQRMEAIGQLSGGVAHDFNNILTVIQGHVELMKSVRELPWEMHEAISEIGGMTDRAANLTRQLLMFSRRQTLQLRDLDLNEVVTSTAKMLQRVLGEDIQMQFHFAPKPLMLHADAGMMDQILLNLAVNARDAMPKGGHLIIESSEAALDELAAAQSPGARPGAYACLSVTDTGCGIPADVLPRIFEPFFTTKEVGKGTGLGLATVFGTVQQHGGWINVYSDVGKGTTFRAYFPLLPARKQDTIQDSPLAPMPRGHETVLLVEDEAAVRSLVTKILSRLGYRVLEANSIASAAEQWSRHRDHIHILLTDIVMPGGMTGIELSELFLKDRPDLKILYSSGYSAELAGKNLLLKEGANFLSKPYDPRTLARSLRASLDSR